MLISTCCVTFCFFHVRTRLPACRKTQLAPEVGDTTKNDGESIGFADVLDEVAEAGQLEHFLGQAASTSGTITKGDIAAYFRRPAARARCGPLAFTSKLASGEHRHLPSVKPTVRVRPAHLIYVHYLASSFFLRGCLLCILNVGTRLRSVRKPHVLLSIPLCHRKQQVWPACVIESIGTMIRKVAGVRVTIFACFFINQVHHHRRTCDRDRREPSGNDQTALPVRITSIRFCAQTWQARCTGLCLYVCMSVCMFVCMNE